jgi:hypothetical protein
VRHPLGGFAANLPLIQAPDVPEEKNLDDLLAASSTMDEVLSHAARGWLAI